MGRASMSVTSSLQPDFVKIHEYDHEYDSNVSTTVYMYIVQVFIVHAQE